MDPLSIFLESGQRETLQFFFAGLREVTAGERVETAPLLYNASILAHFASTSTRSTSPGLPTPASLADVFDRFVSLTADLPVYDAETQEMAGAQCLLLTGFFADQMRARFNLAWYAELGAGFFAHAAAMSHAHPHHRMMRRMAGEFVFWRATYERLARELREQRYLL